MDGTNWGKVIKILLAMAILISIGIFVFWLRNEITLIFLYPYLRDKLVGLGVNIWLAKMIGLPMAIWVLYVSHLLLSLNKEKKQMGYMFGGASWAVWCLCMFFATRDQMFDPLTGQSNACCVATPNGYVMAPCEWKFHPVFGNPVFACDQNMATSEYIKKHGAIQVEKISPTREMAFFSVDGQPLYWYYEQPDGKIDIFNRPGRHPQFNTELQPINAQIVMKIFTQMEARSQVPANIVFHNDDGSVSSDEQQGVNLNHLKDLSDSLKSLNR